MGKIEITMPDSEKAVPVLSDAIERQKRLLSQSLARSDERIQRLSIELEVDPEQLIAGEVPHSENNDMDLIELEGEIELQRHLREQLNILGSLKVCP